MLLPRGWENYTNHLHLEDVLHLLCPLLRGTRGCGCPRCQVRAGAEVAALGMQDTREGCGHEAAQSAWAGPLCSQHHWCANVGSGVLSWTWSLWESSQGVRSHSGILRGFLQDFPDRKDLLGKLLLPRGKYSMRMMILH